MILIRIIGICNLMCSYVAVSANSRWHAFLIETKNYSNKYSKFRYVPTCFSKSTEMYIANLTIYSLKKETTKGREELLNRSSEIKLCT